MFRMKDKALHGVEAAKLRRNMWTYAILIMALGAMTFFGVCDPSGPTAGGPQGSAATVGDEVISRMEFSRAYQNTSQQYQRQFGEQFDASAMRLAHTVMTDLVNGRMMYVRATELGLRASDEEVYAAIRTDPSFKDEEGKFSDESFDNVVRYFGSEAALADTIRRDLTTRKFRAFVTETSYVSTKAAEIDYKLAETKLDVEYLKFDPQKIEAKPSADEVTKFMASDDGKKKIKDYFDANAKEFNQAEQVKARHILVQFSGARNATADAQKRTKDEAKKLADEITGKAKEPGVDFAALAKERTDEAAGKTSGGDLGFFAKDAMVKEFSDVAWAMKPGDVSGVVESPFGFHVIKVEERKEAKTTTLEASQQQIAETLLAKEQKPKLAKEQADKALAEAKEGKAQEGWTATGDVAANSRYLPGIGSSKEVSDALATLSKPGELFPQAIDVRGNFYIVRLKSKKDADMSKFDAEKKKELAASASFSEGYALYSAYEKEFKEQMEKKKAVWMNPDYLALDNAAPAAPGT